MKNYHIVTTFYLYFSVIQQPSILSFQCLAKAASHCSELHFRRALWPLGPQSPTSYLDQLVLIILSTPFSSKRHEEQNMQETTAYNIPQANLSFH